MEKRASLGSHIARGLRKRCPRCGASKIFESWFKLRETCPRCGYRFEREEGYWVGAVIVNTAVIQGLFIVSFLITIFATIPEVPWVPLLVVALVTNGILPWLFYPFAKTLWMGIDLYFHPVEARS